MTTFRTIDVTPIGTRRSPAFVHYPDGCSFEDQVVPTFPASFQGLALRAARVATSTTLIRAARLLGVNVVEVSGLEMGSLTFEDAEAWARATEAIEGDARACGRVGKGSR
jgi:hypothetical protein